MPPKAQSLLSENPILVKFLGLCPFLAVTYKFYYALVLGLITCFVLVFSALLINISKKAIVKELRVPFFLAYIASFTLLFEQLVATWDYSLYSELSIFLPLVITNCILLAHAESVASKKNLSESMQTALADGLGFLGVLLLLALFREYLAFGSIFSDMAFAEVQPSTEFKGIFLFRIAAGGFFLVGILLVIFRWYSAKHNKN